MIKFRHKGDFSKLMRFLESAKGLIDPSKLDKYGREGVAALESATPVDSGTTAKSWGYIITGSDGRTALQFYNSNVNKGVNIAIIIQFGHATRSGTWVEGIDYINPAIRPIFDKISEDIRKEIVGI